MRKLQVLLGFIVALVVLGAVPLRQAQAVTVSPLRLELEADPGQTIQSKFKIYNDAPGAQQTYYISLAKFETKDETGEPFFVPGKTEIAAWATAPASVTVAHFQYAEVPFSITVPQGTEPGGYFAAVFASTQAPKDLNDSNIGLSTDTGTLIFLRVNGEFKKGEVILDFNTANKKHIFSSPPVSFYYRFQNEGADRVKPLGDIEIKNTLRMTTKLVNANVGGGSVLPQSIRRFETTWAGTGGGETQANDVVTEQAPSSGFWKKVQHEWTHFAFGRYTAQLKLVINNDTSRQYTKTVAFWVFPWHLLLTAIVGLVVVLGSLISLAVWIALKLIKRSRK